ncbi:nuclease-related domain-containing protein [Deinococcus sp. Marseille-Q6407]|uniref:nuclease-related domain-containing protein n=1 Tax=Deinococcus sp. Marseille-Q6407 TaxID=2969223 RepID=UPI0021C01F6D|nr:nuclease-related domain-containing protein [Deinococcus sp. Marseille-Q6407]
MIVKEHRPTPTRDKFQRAGDEAEQQMAHYLQRAFGEDQAVHVFNNLRLQRKGETAQLDHLILHRSGMIIVESKSVSTAVRINEREEWSRKWNGDWQGMPSPVLQAQRQAELLRQLLQDHAAQLRRKTLFGLLQGDFSSWQIDGLVAISDRGVLQTKGQRPSVCKADQVPERARGLIEQQAAQGRAALTLNAEEFERVSRFLLMQHREKKLPAASAPAQRDERGKGAPGQMKDQARTVPHKRPTPAGAKRAAAAPASAGAWLPTCSQCHSPHLKILFGHSYYFKCQDCGANTPLPRRACRNCGEPTRTRKQGLRFYADCERCGSSEHFFTNP